MIGSCGPLNSNLINLLVITCGKKVPKEAQEAQEELHYERSHDDDENLLPDETKERLKSIDINENKAERLFKILEGKLNAPDFISFLKEISSFSYPINPKLVPISRKIARTYLTNDTNKKSGMNIYIENLNSSDPLVQKEAKEALIELGATLVNYMFVLCSSENNPDLINIYKEVLKNDNLLETFFYSFYKYNTELENTTKHNIITIINEVDQKRAIKIMVKLLARQDDTNIRNNSFKDLKQISQKSGKDMDNLIIENWEPSYQIYLYDVARALRKVGSSKSKEYTPLFLEALKNYPPDPISPGEGINGSPLSLEIIYFLSQRTAEIKDDLLKIFDNPPNDKVKNAVVFLLMSQAESIAPEIVKKLQIPPELFIDNMMSNYLGFNNGTISNTYSNEYHFTAHHAHDPGFSINIFNNTIKRGDYLDLIIKGNMTRHGKYARFVVQVFDANDDGDHPSVSNPINITKDYSVVRISLKDKIKVPKKINFLLVTDNGSCEVDIKDDIRIMIDYNYFYNLLIDISKLTHKSVDDLIAENWSAEYPIFLPEVARAIGNKQKSEFIPQLFIAANDGGNPAREEAKKALNKMAEKTSDYYFDIVSKGNVKNESLVIKLLDPYWKYIYSSDNRANRILVKLLDDKDKDIRNTIQNTLLQYHKDKPQEIDDLINGHLVPYLSNLDYERPIENYLILEAIKRANISDQLILKDKLLLTAKNINEEKNEYSLEAAAYSILIKLGEPPKGGGRELREHLNKIVVDKEKDLQLRKIAAKLIGDIGSEDGEKALKIVLGVGFFNRRDKDKELCKFSLESIKKIRKNKK